VRQAETPIDSKGGVGGGGIDALSKLKSNGTPVLGERKKNGRIGIGAIRRTRGGEAASNSAIFKT